MMYPDDTDIPPPQMPWWIYAFIAAVALAALYGLATL